MPAPMGSSDLTGERRYRKGWFGGLILQVEELHVKDLYSPSGRHVVFKQWRDARQRDLRMLDYLDRKAKATAAGEPPPAPPDRP